MISHKVFNESSFPIENGTDQFAQAIYPEILWSNV